ncbi:MAG: hypothetical protein KA715_14275 [Xanthomonadaceae bacterium]|nr:hypothetical protein [Xanthomonadaceae bacterium]
MVGIIIQLLVQLSLNSGVTAASQFTTPAPTKIRCSLTGGNFVLGAHYGHCNAKGGAKYRVTLVSLGASLRINGGYFKLKSLDGPFQDNEKISGERYGLSAGLGGDVVRGFRLTGPGGRVKGWMAGIGLGFSVDHVGIHLVREE